MVRRLGTLLAACVVVSGANRPQLASSPAESRRRRMVCAQACATLRGGAEHGRYNRRPFRSHARPPYEKALSAISYSVRHWQAKNNAILAGFALLFHLVLSRVLDHPKVIGILQIVNAAVFSMWFLSMSVLKRGALPEVMKAHFTGTSHLHDFRRRPHMLVLPAFSHADRKHIMGNLGTLQLVGSFILPIIGHREFAQVYSAGAIGGSLLECLFPPLLVRLGLSDSINAEASARSLGASGAITAMVMYACLLEPRATFETKIPFLSDKEQEYPLAVCGAALVAADAYGATRRKGEVRLGDTVEVPDVDNPERIVEVKVLKVRKSATGARFYTVYDEETDEKWRVNEEDVETSSSNVGHTAHLAGASVGLAMFLVNRAIPKAYRHVHRRAVVLHRRMSRRKSRRRRR